jgi:hypothetical protein
VVAGAKTGLAVSHRKIAHPYLLNFKGSFLGPVTESHCVHGHPFKISIFATLKHQEDTCFHPTKVF